MKTRKRPTNRNGKTLARAGEAHCMRVLETPNHTDWMVRVTKRTGECAAIATKRDNCMGFTYCDDCAAFMAERCPTLDFANV